MDRTAPLASAFITRGGSFTHTHTHTRLLSCARIFTGDQPKSQVDTAAQGLVLSRDSTEAGSHAAYGVNARS